MKKAICYLLLLAMLLTSFTGCNKAKTTIESNTESIENIEMPSYVRSVSIRYYIGYNIATGDATSGTIPCQTVKVSGEDLDKLAELLQGLSKVDPYSEAYEHEHIYFRLMDHYELIVNNSYVLRIDDEYGTDVYSNDVFAVPEELYDTVDSIAEEYNAKNVYSNLNVDQVTVTNFYGEVLEITDPEQLEMLSTINYYTIDGYDKSDENDRVEFVMDLHNGDQFEIYSGSVLGNLCHADGSRECVYVCWMEEYLHSLFKN